MEDTFNAKALQIVGKIASGHALEEQDHGTMRDPRFTQYAKDYVSELYKRFAFFKHDERMQGRALVPTATWVRGKLQADMSGVLLWESEDDQ
jgi:hypothetical protein